MYKLEVTPKQIPVKAGTIYLIKEWCKGCNICVEFCPKEVLKLGKDLIPEVIHPEQCTGCGLCEVRCPDFAIYGKWDTKN